MAKKKKAEKQKKIKVPAMFSEFADLIPNEVLYDAFKFNTWVAVFFAGYATITALEDASDDAKKNPRQGAILGAICPAFGIANALFGSERTGEGVGVVIDWEAMVEKETRKLNPNPLILGMLSVMSDDFLRRSIIASGMASTAVFTIYETKFMDNALTGIGSIVEGAVPF